MSIRDKWNNQGSNNGGDFELLPAGTYDCETVDLTHYARPDGIMESELTCQIVHGDNEGRRIWIKCKHAENMAWMMVGIWNACGLTGTPFDDMPEDADDADIWQSWGRMIYEALGASVRIKVDHRKWQGREGDEMTSLSIKTIDAIKTTPAAGPTAETVPW